MNWLALMFGGDTAWQGFGRIARIGPVVGLALLAGLFQLLPRGDTAMQVYEPMRQAAAVFCSASASDRRVLRRIVEDAVSPHRLRIECESVAVLQHAVGLQGQERR
ncbi:MAG: hypothetical protein ACREU9_04310 [Gammaproteobacteria bacterium]